MAALALVTGCTPRAIPATALLAIARVPPAATDGLRPLEIGPRFDDIEASRPPVAVPGPASRTGALPGYVAVVARGSRPRVVVYEVATGAALKVGPEPRWAGPGQPRVSADGRWLTYVGWGSRGRELVLWDRKTRRQVGLPGLASTTLREPDVAADGRSLIYLEGPSRRRRLAIFDVALGAETFFSIDNDLMQAASTPTLSADGLTAAFVSASPRGDADIRVLDLRSGRPIAPPTLNTSDHEQDPALSADGRLLVFCSDRNGSFDLYAYDLEGGTYLPMGAFNSLAQESQPRWLGADDRGLAYVSTREGAPLVFGRPLPDWR